MKAELTAWAKKAATKGGKWPAKKVVESDKLARKIAKSKSEVDNPYALARWMTARGKGSK